MFVAGRAGERFGVRNGGATFVVEGVGDHGCEYMTGGTVVVLGPTGRNFGAGFSGGNTYVLDLDMKKVNPGAIKSGALLFKSLDAETSKLVYALVKQHAEETGSQFAAALLEDWNETVKRFTHVVPKQFVAMTKAMEEAKTNNVDFNAPAPGKRCTSRLWKERADMGDPRGFLKVRTRRELAERPVEERIKDWFDVHAETGLQPWTQAQAARCMDCGTPVLHDRMPAG